MNNSQCANSTMATLFIRDYDTFLEGYKIHAPPKVGKPSNPPLFFTINITALTAFSHSQHFHQFHRTTSLHLLPLAKKKMGFFTPTTMDAKRQAWTRKRPGQASGSDHPRSALSRGSKGPVDYVEEVPIGMSRQNPPSARNTHVDYEEEVPIGMSKRDAAPSLRQQMSQHGSAPRGSLAPAYEEEVPIGMSRRDAPPSQHRTMSGRGPSVRGSRAPAYEEEVPIGMSRAQPRQVSNHPDSRTNLHSRMSHHESRGSGQASRAVRDGLPALSIHGQSQHQSRSRQDSHADQHSRMSRHEPSHSRYDSHADQHSRMSRHGPQGSRHDSRSIREELPALSIHDPQQQRSHQASRAVDYSDDEGYAQQPQHQASQRGSTRSSGRRVSFQEPPVRESRREGSKYDSRTSGRR